MACAVDTDCGDGPLVCSAAGSCLCSTLRGFRGSEPSCGAASAASGLHGVLEVGFAMLFFASMIVAGASLVFGRKTVRSASSRIVNVLLILLGLAGVIFSCISIAATVQPTLTIVIQGAKWIGFASVMAAELKAATQVLVVVLIFLVSIHVGYVILELLSYNTPPFELQRRKRQLLALECLFILAAIIIVVIFGADAIQFLTIGMIALGLFLFVEVFGKARRLREEIKLKSGASPSAQAAEAKVMHALGRLRHFVVITIFIGFCMLLSSVGIVASSHAPAFHNSYDEADNWNAPLAWFMELCFLSTASLSFHICLYTNNEWLAALWARLRRAGFSLLTTQQMVKSGESSGSPRRVIDATAIHVDNPSAQSNVAFSIGHSGVPQSTVEDSIGGDVTVMVVDEDNPALTAVGTNWKSGN